MKLTRDEVLNEILKIKSKNILLELPTGFGKTKLAIEKTKSLDVKTVLLVVSRIVHKDNWMKEFDKWWKDRNVLITMTTYASLHKYAGKYDVVLFDEAHHLSERCRDIFKGFKYKYCILLSATISQSLKDELNILFNDLYVYKKSLRDAIDNKILPDPLIYFIPLDLNDKLPTEFYVVNPKAKGKTIESSYALRWQYIKQKMHPVKIYCTQKQYNAELDNKIKWLKDRFMMSKNQAIKFRWLQLCNKRLKWLSDKKISYVQKLLFNLNDCRTLTFCGSIEQTEFFGKYCINSKNKDSLNNLKLFNDHKINHITSCNMLNEGVNLSDCQIGIYANLNSSDILIKQKTGRLLRHKKPVIIIPYFRGTREEEIADKMKENYNPKLIRITNDISDIKI